ncbi:hypothetical protein F2Q69_00045903 [Brassica cretica]|uniref:Uncharacterized protein n=1 Tax=Brassica cretica TaxID=69181 RepID=A0A8S9NBV6_BRACR|nr:hypothetical protein F2Q69_00045903 [Brassica cretica]
MTMMSVAATPTAEKPKDPFQMPSSSIFFLDPTFSSTLRLQRTPRLRMNPPNLDLHPHSGFDSESILR